MDTWDTEETSRIIANDEYLYRTVTALEHRAIDVNDLAERMEAELCELVVNMPYSDVDISRVDWTEIATEYIEE